MIRKSKELKRTTGRTLCFYMADDNDSAAAVADGVEAHTDEDLGYKTPEQKGWSCIQLFCNLFYFFLPSRVHAIFPQNASARDWHFN